MHEESKVDSAPAAEFDPTSSLSYNIAIRTFCSLSIFLSDFVNDYMDEMSRKKLQYLDGAERHEQIVQSSRLNEFFINATKRCLLNVIKT